MENPLHTQLEMAFHDILTQRMEGLPFVNKHLSVKAIDFHPWNNYQLGILITPWFMNLMLFHDNHYETTVPPKIGSTQTHNFPSGSYEFVAGFEEELGHYQSCSLFSPMFEFEDQHTAELTAREALKAIMSDENSDIDSQNPATEIEQIWNGEIPQPIVTKNFDGTEKVTDTDNEETNQASNTPPRKRLSERLQEPTSRRDFLRGKAFRNSSSNKQNNERSDV